MDIEYLKKIAIKSLVNSKHAAAIIKNNKLYYTTNNKFTTTVRTIHAEINIFYNIPKMSIKNIDIIVIRISKSYELRNSRPCNDCIDKLRKMGIRKVYYSNDEGEIINEYLQDMKKIHISSGARFLKKITN
jgi:cytidine deaminase